MLGRSRAIALVVACLLVGSPAFAQPQAPPTPQQRQKAEGLVKQAIAKSQAKNHAVAIELYLEAYAVVPLASLLSNVGTEYQTDKKPVEALKYFCMYLEKEPTGPLAKYATAQATTLEAELGDQDTTAVCQPMVVPPPVELPPGPPPCCSGPETFIPPQDSGKTLKITGIAVGAVGIVSLGVGVYFGFRGMGLDSDITDHPIGEMWSDTVDQTDASGRFANKVQIATLVTGGVLVTAGAVVYMLGRRKDRANVMVTPSVGAESAGVVVGGRF